MRRYDEALGAWSCQEHVAPFGQPVARHLGAATPAALFAALLEQKTDGAAIAGVETCFHFTHYAVGSDAEWMRQRLKAVQYAILSDDLWADSAPAPSALQMARAWVAARANTRVANVRWWNEDLLPAPLQPGALLSKRAAAALAAATAVAGVAGALLWGRRPQQPQQPQQPRQ